jgi:hypothetical protein
MARPVTAKVPATRAPAARAGRRRRVGGAATLAIIAVTAIAITALPVCVLLAAGLLPSLAAIATDRERGRYLARTVGAMNLAGVVPYALKMWEVGISFASLQQVMASPYAWLVMYGAASCGWLLYLGVPQVTAILLEAHAEQTKSRLESRAKALQEEWGEEVAGVKREG